MLPDRKTNTNNPTHLKKLVLLLLYCITWTASQAGFKIPGRIKTPFPFFGFFKGLQKGNKKRNQTPTKKAMRKTIPGLENRPFQDGLKRS
ncbi:MAG: hypothetical protein N2484_01000 [Clostridia bacterium]|nr:hypothetical protein [Clostridia bacterium]